MPTNSHSAPRAAPAPLPPLVRAKLTEAIRLHQAGQLKEAAAAYAFVLQMQPRQFDALHRLGIVCIQQNTPQRAIELLRKALKVNPDSAHAHSNLGNALLASRQADAAVASFDRAIAIAPDFAEAHVNRGDALRRLRQFEAAVASFKQAIALQPDLMHAYANLGKTLEDLGQPDQAVAVFDRAIAISPDSAAAFYNRGNALKGNQQPDAALASYDQAIGLNPAYAEAFYNKGVVLQERNQIDPAVAHYRRAIEIDPNDARTHLNLATALLTGADHERGWQELEWRWRSFESALVANRRGLRQPGWLGSEALAGKTILLQNEQGLGDTLQFCRYAKLVSDLGARVILEVQAPLVQVLRDLEGVDQLLPDTAKKIPEVDFHCALMSLPLALGTTLETIPNQVPYIRSRPEKVAAWQTRLAPFDALRVGLVWSGNFVAGHPELKATHARRNIPLQKLAPLRMDGVTFYSLQKGQPAEAELPALIQAGWSGPPIIDLTAELQDFSDTAALIEHLDLVISVDTSTAHLAGAMGKPVWVLNRFDTCWRWMLERDDSPWYPTLKLYRQTTPGDWDSVVERVRNDLIGLVQARRQSPAR
jgi:tetratricopeptide (TPR) repeat protein